MSKIEAVIGRAGRVFRSSGSAAAYHGYTALCLTWFLVLTLPAWLVYALLLGAIRLDFRFGPAHPLFAVPGWTRSELSWVLPSWRPF